MNRLLLFIFSLCIGFGLSEAAIPQLSPHPQKVKENGKAFPVPSSFHPIGTDELSPNTLRLLLRCVDDHADRNGFPLRVGIRDIVRLCPAILSLLGLAGASLGAARALKVSVVNSMLVR